MVNGWSLQSGINGKQICWKKRVACLTQAVAAILEFLLARKMHILSRTIQPKFPFNSVDPEILNSFSHSGLSISVRWWWPSWIPDPMTATTRLNFFSVFSE
jgi:hypothetical protein